MKIQAKSIKLYSNFMTSTLRGKHRLIWDFYSPMWRHRHLLRRLVFREIQSQYRGTVLGFFWYLIEPLCKLAIYTFIFSGVMRMRFSSDSSSPFQYALLVFSGLLLFNILSTCITKSVSTIRKNQIFVKQMAFQTELLPIALVIVALLNAGLSLLILLVFYQVAMGGVPATAFMFAIVIIPIVLWGLGISWILASLGVFFQDITPMAPMISQVLLFLSPIFYPLAAVPEKVRWAIALNPIATVITMSREVLFQGVVPNGAVLLAHIVGSWLFAVVGYTWFMKTKKRFADVL